MFHFMAQLAQFLQVRTGQSVAPYAVIRSSLLNPIMNRGRAGFLFPRPTLNTATSPVSTTRCSPGSAGYGFLVPGMKTPSCISENVSIKLGELRPQLQFTKKRTN